MSYNSYNKNFKRSVRTPQGTFELQMGHKGRKCAFWTLVWPSPKGQVSVRYQTTNGSKYGKWGITMFLTGGPDLKPGVNSIRTLETDKTYNSLEASVEASVKFLDKMYPRAPGGSFKEKSTYAQKKLETPQELLEMKPVKPKEKKKPMFRKDAPWSF